MRNKITFLFYLLFSCIGFASQVVLVTGASQGIGLSIVETLASEQSNEYTVYAGVRKSSETAKIELLKAQFPNRIHVVDLDVTSEPGIKHAIDEIIDRHGAIDFLVNNAGIMIYGSVENVSIKEAEAIFDVNFMGVMRVCQAVLPQMRKQKSGRIIQISSRSGFRPYPSLGIYAASKYALTALSETMAAQLKPWNISVSLIEPGPVNTLLDYVSPYGSRFAPSEDPYLEMFKNADALYPDPDSANPNTQEPKEIAKFVLRAMQEATPKFRYQTAPYIEEQAKTRLVDISGNDQVAELEQVFFPSPSE